MKVGEVFAEIGLDQSGFNNGLDRAENKFKAWGSKMKSYGTKMTLGVSLPLLAVGVASFKLASDTEEALNKVDVAFSSNASQVKTWAETTLETYGIAKGSALDMAALFGDMGTAMGLSTRDAAKMSMSMVGLAGDLSSFKNIGLDQASDALRGIFTGEGESLKTLGIIMQDSTLEAYALATGQKKSYKEMSQAERVALRYAFVMDATKNSQGDFARTSDGAANQTRIFKESLKELGATFGSDLLPLLTPVIQEVNELVQGFADMSPEGRKVVLLLAGFGIAAGPALTAFGTLISSTKEIRSLFKFLSAGKAVGSIGGVGSSLGLLASPAGPIFLVVAAVAALSVAWYIWGDDVKAVCDKVNWQMSHLKTPGRTGGTNEGKMPTYVKPTYNPVSAGDEALSSRWKKHAKGGIITKPTILSDAKTGIPYGSMVEEGPEAIVPLNKLKGGSSTVTVNHTGTIIHKGINNLGELVATVKQEFIKDLENGNKRTPDRVSIYAT